MGLNEFITLLGWLVAFLVAVVTAPILWEKRASIVAGLRFGVNHFVEIRRPDPADYVESEGEDEGADQDLNTVHTHERPNEGAVHLNASERPFGGSGTVHERGDELVLDSAQVDILRRITAHKLQQPRSGKAESIYTLFGAKKGSSARYQECSEIWDLLYPPKSAAFVADDPDAWQPGERAGTLVRVK